MSRPVGLVHGYGLSGSGSNLWTRAILRALCELGHDVHVVCQESRPESFDFVSRAIKYDDAGTPNKLFARETGYSGSCTVHRPDLDVLPVYVAPRRPSTYVRAIPGLDDASIAAYVERNARVLSDVAAEHGVGAFHVNHVVLMSVALQTARERGGAPYVVLPHGSAIEYVVKKDPRMMTAASAALRDAGRVLALNAEMETRLSDVFGDVPGLMEKVDRLPVGVDTAQFESATVEERPERIERLLGHIADLPRGRSAQQQRDLGTQLHGDLTDDQLLNILQTSTDYASSAPDEGVDDRLRNSVWHEAPLVSYVGRLISAKGAHMVIAAFPLIVREVPSARLIVAGTGALREALEALVWALGHGEVDLARRIARLGSRLEDYPDPKPFDHLESFFARLDRENGWDVYLAAASTMREPDRVLFTGFMDHGPLSQLYAISDVGLFPSVVREASPLVVPESAASGTFPIGTDYGGMGDSLRTLGRSLPDEARPLLTARPDPEHTIMDLGHHAAAALNRRGEWSEMMRRAAVEQYDWHKIAARLVEILEQVANESKRVDPAVEP